MMGKEFKALVVEENENGGFIRRIANRKIQDLPEGEVLVKVHFAGLNYKDAMSASGNKGITKRYPHTPGIDASGIVAESTTSEWKVGEKVIVHSHDLGMNTSGAFAEYIRVPADWVLSLPENLSLQESMILGTGGFTAALSVYKMLQNGQNPNMGPIVVTGATGGVGSMAVSILSQIGFEVHASSGKKEAEGFLKKLGASKIISRKDVNDTSGKPLLRSQWAGAIDTVGGNTLATLFKACARNGNIAVCGLVDSPLLETTVYPFILNGVNLLGIETAETPKDIREKIWEKLANEWKPNYLDEMKNIIKLDQLDENIEEMLKGKSKGRTVVIMI